MKKFKFNNVGNTILYRIFEYDKTGLEFFLCNKKLQNIIKNLKIKDLFYLFCL